jgi:hypothetical protein
VSHLCRAYSREAMGGSLFRPSPDADSDSAESSERMEVPEETDISKELREFIDQLVVPLLVEMVKNGHLYKADPSYYD